MTELADRFEFVVRWEPYLLRPETPPEGAPKPAVSQDPTNPRAQPLIQAGLQVGIDFTHKSKRFPSTIKPHALLEYSKHKNDGAKQNDIVEKLFHIYFTDGELLTNDLLLSVAQDAGFEVDEVQSYINDETNLKCVVNKAKSWMNKGVQGVPYFYMNGHRMFSGAQDVETFKRTLQMAAEKFPVSPSNKT